jgi:hypothetical protein
MRTLIFNFYQGASCRGAAGPGYQPFGLAIRGKVYAPLYSGAELSAPIPQPLRGFRYFRSYPLRILERMPFFTAPQIFGPQGRLGIF